MSTSVVISLSVLYFIIGFFFIKKEVKIYQLVSVVLFSNALMLSSKSSVVLFVCLAAPVLCVLLKKTHIKNIQILYYSTPCWVILIAVVVNVFILKV